MTCIGEITYSKEQVHSKNANSKDTSYLEEARKIAEKSILTHKHGCVIVYRNKIIAWGNNVRVDTGEKEFTSIHSEESAINMFMSVVKNSKYSINRSECKIYIVRINNSVTSNQTYKNSFPCRRCRKRIETSGIQRILFTYKPSYHENINESTKNDYSL